VLIFVFLLDPLFGDKNLLIYTLSSASVLLLGTAGITFYQLLKTTGSIDAIKTKKEKQLYLIYMILNIVGVLTGLYASFLLGRTPLAVFFVLLSALFYWHATMLQYYLLLGDLLITALSLLGIGIPVFISLLFVASSENAFSLQLTLSVLSIYGGLAALLIFAKIQIDHILTINEDHKREIKTIPLILGVKRTMRIVCILLAPGVIYLFYVCYDILFKHSWMVIFTIFGLMAPLLYVIISGWNSKKQKDFIRLNRVLTSVLILMALSFYFLYSVLFKTR